MEADSNLKVEKLRVDGGPSNNEFLMQFQADVSGVPVEVPYVREVTAQGTAMLAGFTTDFWNIKDLKRMQEIERIYRPRMAERMRSRLLHEWKRAVPRARNWAEESRLKPKLRSI